ncbi:MAG: hypothetical protein JW833_09005, partial [Prolixibacteraceae bacterium]|nr:hypothetical protein [Prolixibacteraceae bacterium]
CPEFESVYDNIWHRINGYRLQFISDFVYNTNELKKNNGFYELPLAWFSDDVTSFIAAVEKGIAYTSETLLCFRRSPESISSSGDPEKKLQAFKGFTEWLNSFLEIKPNNNNDKIVKEQIIYFYPEYKKNSLVEALTDSYKKDNLLKIFRWIMIKKQFNITNKEILLSVLKYFKHKAGRLFNRK